MKTENYKLQTMGGNMFTDVAKKAKQIAVDKKVTVEFDFNEVKCFVNENTVVDWLNREYVDSHLMEWKTVGPDCKMEYDEDTEIELRKRQLYQAEKRKADNIAYKLSNNEKKRRFEQTVSGIEIEILPGKEEEYKAWVEKNSTDGYSKCVVDYAEGWAKLMQLEIAKGKTIKQCAESSQKPLDFYGITGFMYGCAVGSLSGFWKHGEELRKWHNKIYGVKEDKGGVVNPAILTLNS